MQISADIVSGLAAFLFTVMVLSYALSDNPIFRAALAVFVGVSAGYVAVIVWQYVLVPGLFTPLLQGSRLEQALAIISLLGAALLLTKLSPRLSHLGTPIVAYMVGVGAAVAIGGAILGTLFPQIEASINLLNLTNTSGGTFIENLVFGIFILLGTITTLIYFQFSNNRKAAIKGRRTQVMRLIAFIGKIFISITFGVLFAAVFAAALTAFVERIVFFVQFFSTLY